MKKILVIAMVALLCCGCSKKDDTPGTIVGKWYETSRNISSVQNGVTTLSLTSTYNHTNFIIFNADGTGMSVGKDSVTIVTIDTIKFTYTISGKTLTYHYPPYKIMGDSVLASSQVMNINILTSGKLETEESDTNVIFGANETDSETIDYTR